MLGEPRIKQIADAILARSTADQTEIVIQSGDSALTRFANSTIHQNVHETDARVRVRVILQSEEGARIGVSATNDLGDDALAQVVESAQAIARLQRPNPQFKSLPGPQPIPAVTAFCEATAGCTPEQRARGVGDICLQARAKNVVASGALTTAALEIAVVNSLGTFAYLPTTYADINTVVMSDTSAGYAAAMAMDVNDLDFEAIGSEAVNKCERSRNPRPLDPGQYTVILEPYAVQDIVNMLSMNGLSATAVQEGRSFMIDKFGQRIVDPRVSIWDDGLSAAGIPWPFDFEGVPKQRVDMILNGVANAVVYDSYSAGKEGKASTGHALPAPNPMGPIPTAVFFGTGDGTLAEMIKHTERGLYVTRFHYTRPVEPIRVVITGMTRDGTFWIENGEIAYPVKNLRFTQSYLEALNHVEQIGSQAKLLPGWQGMMRDCVPALKLGAFTFTGATQF